MHSATFGRPRGQKPASTAEGAVLALAVNALASCSCMNFQPPECTKKQDRVSVLWGRLAFPHQEGTAAVAAAELSFTFIFTLAVC
eukprot:6490073-Amphidinium_carterae.1